MSWRLTGSRSWLVWAGLVACVFWQAGLVADTVADPSALLKQAWLLPVTDHPRFVVQLAELDLVASRLKPDEQWRLRYLDAWEAMYEADYAKSEVQFQDVIQHSGNPLLADRASALLLSQFGITRRYTEAFELANRLVARLPQVTDAKVRYVMLLNLSQSLGLAGQTDLAVRYAHMAMGAVPAGESPCYAAASLVVALDTGHRLKSGSPELRQALVACPAATEPVYNTDLTVTLTERYVQERQPRKALVLLDRIAPSVEANDYAPNKLSALVDRAQALAALGDDDDARKVALAVVAAGKSGDIDAWLKDTYEVLYRIEERQGHAAAALGYYKKYAALDKAYLDDVSARATAYQTVQQHLLAQKLETENLSRQNALLRVRQTLDTKKAEANRLYLALLLLALVSAGFWMFRLKRSQIRFKRLSHLDGLTAIFNRQHFMGEMERTLRLLERRAGATCLVFIDLDHFKQINDTHGHAMGDEVLCHIVAVCRQHLRSADLFGRLGGEEFGILLVECTRAQGMAIAERIRAAIEATRVESDSVVVRISVSAGLSFTDACGHDLQRLCKEADAALYRAKRRGRNRVADDVEDSCLLEA